VHDYSLDTLVRRYVDVGIAIASLSLPTVITWAATLISAPPELTFPISFGATFALFYYVFDEHIWKRFQFVHKIPDLNGDWIAEGVSSYRDPDRGENLRFSMRLKIKQSFSRIEVFTETDNSTSRSFMASLELQHAVPIFRYGFDNTPKNMANAELQRHPGMMDLRISGSDLLEGDYFSGKHRLRYGELSVRRVPK
jgi:hypothetical protein